MASWSDLLHYSLTSLQSRSLRSWLTVLGIVIGIAAIVSRISIAQGLEATVKDQISAFGALRMQLPKPVSEHLRVPGHWPTTLPVRSSWLP